MAWPRAPSAPNRAIQFSAMPLAPTPGPRRPSNRSRIRLGFFCHLAAVGHWHDVGGAVPGNYNPRATEVFQEVFVLPPVRLMRDGVLQTDIVDILLRNTRLPQSAQGDRNGQINALDLGVRRLDALIAEFAALPDGRWEAGDFLDNDGVSDTPLPIRVAVEIKGEDLTLDFTGSAPARVARDVRLGYVTAEAADTAYGKAWREVSA